MEVHPPKWKACSKRLKTDSGAHSKVSASSNPVEAVGVAGVEEEDAGKILPQAWIWPALCGSARLALKNPLGEHPKNCEF